MNKKVILLLLILLTGCHSVYMPPTETVELPSFEAKKPIHIALVLGGGGSKGLALLGAIQELDAAGIRPDLIVGCSAGAMAGALYADGQELNGLEKNFLTLKRADILDFSYFRPLFGIVEGKSIQNLVRRTLHAKTFEALKIPLIVVATDLYSGDVVEICHGDIPSAVGASCAFPGIFKPVQLFGRYLVDGGASCPVPVSVAKKHGAEIVIAIDVTGKLPATAPQHLIGIGKRSIDIAYRKFVELSLSQADIVIKMEFEDCGTFTDHLNEHLYEQGRKTVRNMLPEIQKRLKTSD
ncbi:MAG: patatin-like phospholipase family protein [Rhabdochlamydiaceae bacterium]